ncbi:MAG: hypothetical protein IKJ11_02710 [Clostridia bacterium]|nr:hypothetical protein [Clostridia bacterium]
MMKKATIQSILVRACACVLLLCAVSANALAYNAQTAADWLQQFAKALQGFVPVNDPAMTADPARAGQRLLEYEFGTVLVRGEGVQMSDILEIDIRSPQVKDCRNVCVGMPLEETLESRLPEYSASPLYVLGTQEAGYGWSWAYLSENGVYGVEYIAYGGEGASMKEYTLTYVIESGVITAIRMKIADALLAQAQEGLETAEEIASRQDSEVLIAKNNAPMLTQENMLVMGGEALGVPVAQLVARLGEPQSVQTLPQGTGRVLVYDGAVVTLGFNEYTGEELVRALSVNSAAIEGPNRLKVGMDVGTAGSLFRADSDLYARGGTLYLEGEALGEAPYGELMALDQGELMLRYACLLENGDTAMLQAVIQDDVITYWHLMYADDVQGGV